MNLHEYQAKALFKSYGIPVPVGGLARSSEQALALSNDIGGNSWVVKAQIHSRERGPAGGVCIVRNRDELVEMTGRLLSKPLVTAYTSDEGLQAHSVMIERTEDIAVELYLAMVMDRNLERIVCVASAAGGANVEFSTSKTQDRVHRVAADAVAGFLPFHGRQLAYALEVDQALAPVLTDVMLRMYRLFTEKDLSLIEINPLALTRSNEFVAIDIRVRVDDNALIRQPEMASLRDEEQEDYYERQARSYGLNYVNLDGNIGCIVNGAGLAMATMDLVKFYGGDAANFLDVGGISTSDHVAEAVKLLVTEREVSVILVNVFGGIVRCDLIAKGLISASRELKIDIPLVVRMMGSESAIACELLKDSGLNIQFIESLDDSARKAVSLARSR